MFANRVLVWPVGACCGLVDDRNLGCAHDILVVGTEAGIDTALYWTGQSYAWFQPVEEP